LGTVAGTGFTGFAGCDSSGGTQVLYAMIMMIVGPFTQGSPDGHGFQDYGISVGKNGVILIRDGGPTEPWVMVQSGTTVDLNYVKMHDSPDSSVAFAVGDSGTVLRSDDWGHTWSDRSIPSRNDNLYGLDFISYFSEAAVHLVVVGDSGLVFKSTNMGGNWTWVDISVPTFRRFNSVGAVNADFIIAVGEDGIMERTTNGGTSWNLVFSTIFLDIHRVFVSRFSPYFNRMWAVADSGKILTSIDYGSSWVVRSSGTTEHLRDVLFRNADEGIAVRDSGTVRYTMDGGTTWLTDPFLDGLTTGHILSVALLDSVTVEGIITSSSANASSTDSTFFLAVSSEPITAVSEPEITMPESFALGQNYPNPFNPTTTIRYEISDYGFVLLEIYDLLGHEIAELVNEEQDAGTYDVKWDATGRPSGIYFCRLSASGISETKRLVLIR